MPGVKNILDSTWGGAAVWAGKSAPALPPLPALPTRGPLIPKGDINDVLPIKRPPLAGGGPRPESIPHKPSRIQQSVQAFHQGGSVAPAVAAAAAAPPSLTRGLSTPGRGMGLVGAGILGGMGGYTMGNQDLSSFAAGASFGLGAGALARPMARNALGRSAMVLRRNAQSVRSNNPSAGRQLNAAAERAAQARRAMNTQDGRYLMHAGGSLLAGGAFGSMFMSGNRKNHRRGFNQSRGNTF